MKVKRIYICRHSDEEYVFAKMSVMCRHFGFSSSTVKAIIKQNRHKFKIKGVSIEAKTVISKETLINNQNNTL
jgi:hypothetical protein